MTYVPNDFVPVREFTSVATMQAHYKALRARTFERPAERLGAVSPHRSLPTPPKPIPAPVPAEEEQTETKPDLWADAKAEARATLAKGRTKVSARGLIAEAAEILGYPVDAIVGPRRIQKLAHARQDAVLYVSERRPDLSLPALGRLFGGRDHTTALHAIRVARRRREERNAAGLPHPLPVYVETIPNYERGFADIPEVEDAE